MDIDRYLKRIGDKGLLKGDRSTLDRLMTNHLAAIKFDQQLDRHQQLFARLNEVFTLR